MYHAGRCVTWWGKIPEANGRTWRLAALAVAVGLLLYSILWNGVQQHLMYKKIW
jgi:hypothetical protein